MHTSIIIIVYNGIRYLERCLASVQREIEAGCEIIVVDNASTDGSAELVEQRWSTVRLIRNESNRGFAAACNQGAEIAAGRVLVFLNQDTRVEPGWLRALIRGVEQEKAIGLATSRILLMSQLDRVHLCGQDVHYTGLVFGRGFLDAADEKNTVEEVAAVAGASFAIRREVWEALGGFDELFYMYYEETDLSWRARLAGYRCLYVPDSVVHHDHRPSQINPARLYYSIRNRHVMVLKNWKWATLLLIAPSLLLAELIEWWLAARGGWSGLWAKIRADFWVLIHLPAIIRLHNRVQAGRKVSDAVVLAERDYRLNPRTLKGGGIENLLVAACTILFRFNHWMALHLCRMLRL